MPLASKNGELQNLNGDFYPLPNIIEILGQTGNSKHFSVTDVSSRFHQIKMSQEDAAKTAFSTSTGHYQFNRMPFGLKNAPATFQKLMNNVLTEIQTIALFILMIYWFMLAIRNNTKTD